MGNSNNKHRPSEDGVDGKVVRRRNKKNGRGKLEPEPRDKHISCPDLGGAVPYKFTDDSATEVKLYRSYGNLTQTRHTTTRDEPSFRMYRKSSEGLPKYSTLPRNFGRSKSAAAALANGSVRRRAPDSEGDREPRPMSVGSLATAAVQMDDLPNTVAIKRKLKLFEDHFSVALTQKYQSLTDTVQLSALAIAIRRTGTDTRYVSLYDYLGSQSVPCDFVNDKQEKESYIMLVPEALMHGIKHVRKDKISEMGLWTSLARDLVTCVAVEAANEIARMFEYQISVLSGEASVKTLAGHAADCVIAFIKKNNAYLERNTAILGVVRGYPPEPETSSKYLSVVLGNRELKWHLFDIFKKPGLRRELQLFTDNLGEEESAPWNFYTSQNCEPDLFGYRSLLVEWDWVDKFYRVNAKDESAFDEEVEYRSEDFHRFYLPYRRLFGLNMMLHFIDLKERGRTTAPLAQFINYSAGGAYVRDEVQPVYRPLAPPQRSINFGNTNLDNVDLTRAQLKRADLSRTSVKNSRLLHADAANAKLREADVTGADLSYSNMAGADIKPENLKGITVKHAILTPRKKETGDKPRLNGHAGTNAKRADVNDNSDAVDSGLDMGSPEKVGMVSDAQGNILSVDQIIVQKQKELEEEKRRAKESSRSNGASPPSTLVSVERIRDEKDTRRPKKGRQNRQSSTDNNALEAPDRRQVEQAQRRSQTPDIVIPAHAQQVGYAPKVASGCAPEVTVNGLPPDRPSSAEPYAGTPRHQSKSYSTTDIQGAHSGQNERLSPPGPATGTQQPSSDTGTYPRMTKSISHHGQLIGGKGQGQARSSSIGDSYGLAWYPGRNLQQPSREEIEYITRSQIFTMMKGLHIDNIGSNLGQMDPLFVDRGQDLDNVADLLSSSGRIVTITGCYGTGKSSLAAAVGQQLRAKFVMPVLVNAHGCFSTASVCRQMMRSFGLHFKPRELGFFFNWLNCHEQRLLIVIDNVDLKAEEDDKLSDLLDELMMNVKNLRLLCTSTRHFYKGHVTHEVYRLGDLRQGSVPLLQQLTPDLHDEGIESLADACDHLPYLLRTVAKVFTMADVDAGKLFEDITTRTDHASLERVEDEIYRFTGDVLEQQRLRKVACGVLMILDNIPLAHAEMLSKASVFASSFNVQSLKALIGGADEESTSSILRELADNGLVLEATEGTNRYTLPSLIKFVTASKLSDNGSTAGKYMSHFVERLKFICAMYHSKNCDEALNEFEDNFDNVIDVLWRVMEREDTYEVCPSFATMEHGLFLSEVLPLAVYTEFYESLAQQAEEQGDPSKQVRALCCLAHRYLVEGNVSNARQSTEKAYEAVNAHSQTVSDTDKAFCLRCMGKVYWDENQDRARAMSTVKNALDIYKIALGSRHLQTLYTNELYAWMMTRQEHNQTARHFFNVSDLFVKEALDDHPLMLDGYDSRRIIWDQSCLFARATDMAKKAARVSQRYYGDHPVTARMMSSHCECIIKRGSLNEAVNAAIQALAIRIKVLGDHLDTGLSYKTLAHLMLRSGQYDEAARLGQCALDIFDKLAEEQAGERLRIDAKNLIAQARYRLEYKSSVFVELQSKDGSKRNTHNPELDVSRASAVSTEV